MALASSDIALTDSELGPLIELTRSLTGINFDETRAYLLEARLRPLLTRFGLQSFSALQQLVQRREALVLDAFVDAVTINETFFFRDKAPFELFKQKLVPELLSKNSRAQIRVWCAACSTGQEIYSLCIALKEAFGDVNGLDIRLTGTDISAEALDQAKRAEYNHFEISRGLSTEQMEKYFNRTNGFHYKLLDELRSMVSFNQANLLDPTSENHPYDIIFCRNVSCYFEPENKRRLFMNLARQLKMGGVLVLGGAENLLGVSDQFTQETFNGTIYYRRTH